MSLFQDHCLGDLGRAKTSSIMGLKLVSQFDKKSLNISAFVVSAVIIQWKRTVQCTCLLTDYTLPASCCHRNGISEFYCYCRCTERCFPVFFTHAKDPLLLTPQGLQSFCLREMPNMTLHKVFTNSKLLYFAFFHWTLTRNKRSQ